MLKKRKMKNLINKVIHGCWQDYADSMPDKPIDVIIDVKETPLFFRGE